MAEDFLNRLTSNIRDVKDFPKPGIIFKDLTPVLQQPALFRDLIAHLAAPWKTDGITKIAAVESRGFIFGAPLALELNAGLCLVRKAGKLPHDSHRASYKLEYGEATVELHKDAVKPGDKVLIVDDLLATGGTAQAATKLVTICGGQVAGYSFVIELAFLKGAVNLAPTRIESLLRL
jgi:adenine phosphoribosyltransferase